MPFNPKNKLEPKFGWGCKEHHLDREAIVAAVQELKYDSSWRPHEVVRNIAELLKKF